MKPLKHKALKPSGVCIYTFHWSHSIVFRQCVPR